MSRLLAGPPPRKSTEPPSLDLFREEMASAFSDVSGLESLAKRAETAMDVSTLTLHADGKLVRGTGPLQKAELCKEYGLQARDLRLLDGNLTESSPSILVRSRSIIYSSALIQAIITPDKLVLFDDPHPPDVADLGSRLRPDSASIAKAVALYFRVINSSPQDSHYNPAMSFEHRVLEALLMLVTRGYRRSLRKLEASALEVVDGLKADVSTSEIRALADTSRVVEDFLARCSALTHTLNSVLHADDEDLNAMYLSEARNGRPRSGGDHQEVEMLLESMLQRADETRQNAQNLMLRLRNADQHMTLSLSATRNRLLLMELRVAVIMLAITTAVALPSLFGANLKNGLEQNQYAFFVLAGVAFILAAKVARSGFAALSHTRRSQVVLQDARTQGVEGRRRMEVSKRQQAAADQLKAERGKRGNGSSKSRWSTVAF